MNAHESGRPVMRLGLASRMSPISSGNSGSNSGRHLAGSKSHEPSENAEGLLVKSKRPSLISGPVVSFEDFECYVMSSQDLCQSQSSNAGSNDEHMGSIVGVRHCWPMNNAAFEGISFYIIDSQPGFLRIVEAR